MGGEQSTFTFALHGNGKRGIVYNRTIRRLMVVFAIGNVGTVDGDCWRCGDVAVRRSQKAGDILIGRNKTPKLHFGIKPPDQELTRHPAMKPVLASECFGKSFCANGGVA